MILLGGLTYTWTQYFIIAPIYDFVYGRTYLLSLFQMIKLKKTSGKQFEQKQLNNTTNLTPNIAAIMYREKGQNDIKNTPIYVDDY